MPKVKTYSPASVGLFLFRLFLYQVVLITYQLTQLINQFTHLIYYSVFILCKMQIIKMSF